MRFEVCHNLRNQVEDGKLIWCVLSPMWEISNMEKYLYVVYIISSFESRYPQTSSCAGCYFNANSFERSMTLSYSGLHWDCLTVLMYFLDLQDMDAVFLEVWATDISKPIAVCFSNSHICNIHCQTFLRSNIWCILFFQY